MTNKTLDVRYDFTPEQIVKLKEAGCLSEYIEELRYMGEDKEQWVD